ncbi:MAG: hypothetical protein ACN6OB_16900 [Chryseobacterium jejuense]|uniref:hypothetical protein n=1 Tax=Chryseobacterium jejuense TaxID=445960 RepID=UPI003D0C85C8
MGPVFIERNTVQLEKAVEMFVKTIPFYLQIDENLTFESQVRSCHNRLNTLEEKVGFSPAYTLNEQTDFLMSY